MDAPSATKGDGLVADHPNDNLCLDSFTNSTTNIRLTPSPRNNSIALVIVLLRVSS